MVTFYEVEGFDEFVQFVECLKRKSEPIFVYFAGSQGADGKSWCPDCEEGESTADLSVSHIENNVLLRSESETTTQAHGSTKKRFDNIRTDNNSMLILILTLISFLHFSLLTEVKFSMSADDNPMLWNSVNWRMKQLPSFEAVFISIGIEIFFFFSKWLWVTSNATSRSL